MAGERSGGYECASCALRRVCISSLRHLRVRACLALTVYEWTARRQASLAEAHCAARRDRQRIHPSLSPLPARDRPSEQNIRGVSYYGKDVPGTPYSTHIYLIGNHALHYGVLGAWALFAAAALLYVRYRNDWALGPGLARFKPFFAQAAFCALVYVVNLAPYVGVARSTFIYHYMPALLYAELLAAITVDWFAGPRWRGVAVRVYAVLVASVFLFNYPWVFAFPITNDGHARRRWLPRWN